MVPGWCAPANRPRAYGAAGAAGLAVLLAGVMAAQAHPAPENLTMDVVVAATTATASSRVDLHRRTAI
jgi:hypothetical protein